MADVQIIGLPTAPTAITGAELVPVVQNGLTVQTTVSAITQSPTQTQTFLTVGQQTTLPNSRYFSTGTGLGITDGGAQGAYSIALNGTSGSLEGAGTGVIVKSAANIITARSLAVSGSGIGVTNGSGISGNPTFALTGLPLALANTSGTGMLAVNGAALSPVTITGTANQIGVINGNGVGNPTVSIANDPVIGGNAGLTLPIGTTLQRVNNTGAVRLNSDLTAFEGYNGTSWTTFLTSSVTTFSAGTTGFAPSSPTAGVVTLSGILNSANGGTGAASLTGYLFGNGASPATASTTIPATSLSGTVSSTNGGTGASALVGYLFSNGPAAATASSTIPTSSLSGQVTNAQLVNSSITINGNTVSLGGSATIPSNTTNPLTISTGLSGTSFDGSAPVTIAINNTGVTAGTYGNSSSFPIITVNAQGQVTSVSTGAVPNTYQGTWNASTNSPTLTSSVGTAGYYYIVSTAGSTNLNGITSWAVGDWAAFNGSVWQKIAGTSTGTFASLTVTGVATLNQVTFGGAAGTSGYFLTSAGAGGTPTWTQGVGISDVGYAANQIPLNQYLGRLAYQDALSSADDGSQVFVGVSDVGNRANQVPLNQYLGGMAWQDPAGVDITGGSVSGSAITGGSVNNTTIGAATPSTGAFTTLSSTNDATINSLAVGKGNSAISTNMAVGVTALAANTTGAGNTGIGYQALKANTTGSSNTVLGFAALALNIGGGSNTGIGYYAIPANTSGIQNTGVGAQTLNGNTTGGGNTAIGYNALFSNISDSNNTAVGSQALYGNTTGGSNNSALGYRALFANTTGIQNTAIGVNAGNTLTTGSNNTLIGYNAAPTAITVSNEITLGNGSVTSFRIPGLTITAGAKWINVGSSTVALLPSAATAGLGARAFVTDALAPAFGSTVAGSGAVATPVYSDGTNWKVG